VSELRSDFHPELRALADVLPRTVVTADSLITVRQGLQAVRDRQPRCPEVMTTDTGVQVRVHRSAGFDGTAGPALLWMHGGGFVMGDARQDDALCRSFAMELGIVVGAVDYRLAPECPYPAALDDCQSALALLAGLSDVDAGCIAVGGASAGGGLAAALSARLRGSADVKPALQLLVYPMLDDRTTEPNPRVTGRLRLWDQHSNNFGWASYLGNSDATQAVPARLADFGGLAPAWIGVGDLDLFYDENVVYAQRLREAGVSCHLERVPGAFHGFDVVMPWGGLARQFFASQCAHLRAAFEL
jgi:acetyl esterase/lipase